jgi:hypothetical protein
MRDEGWASRRMTEVHLTPTSLSFPHALGGNPALSSVTHRHMRCSAPVVSLDARQKHDSRGMTAKGLPKLNLFLVSCDNINSR